MYCTRRISEDVWWVGGNDRRLAMFEGVYSVPKGVSYNAYLLMDESTVLMDTVDKAVGKVFFENLAHVLGDRKLDYVVVQHMEPDHSATLEELLLRHPETMVVCTAQTERMIGQFFSFTPHTYVVKEGSFLNAGRHKLTFYMAPMVHWPEVMVTYDEYDKTLYSADAFGTFGALNGALFADEVDFDHDYIDEARRYYTNIVGKYGQQVQALLKKAAGLDIKQLCPLHGFVWRTALDKYLAKYQAWSTYTPEENGVMLAYASIYGNTENAADILAVQLMERGIKTQVYDVSVTPASEIVAASFRFSHLVFASATYNAGIFVSMDALLNDLAAHNIQNRTVALIQNGSWAPSSGKLMRALLEKQKNMTFLNETVDIRSSVKDAQRDALTALADAIASTMPKKKESKTMMDEKALYKLSYGLFVLTANENGKDNGCIINTCQQLASSPLRLSIAVNKQNYTEGMIARTGCFNVSVLSESAPFALFERFGFHSGRDTDKFAGDVSSPRNENGIRYLKDGCNAVFACKVVSTVDAGSHTLFIAEVTGAEVFSSTPSMTYAYYFANVKPKPQPKKESQGKVWVCKICGYVYDEKAEGVPFDQLPADWTCPLCKHPKSDFELQA